jgi:hypothetical protein
MLADPMIVTVMKGKRKVDSLIHGLASMPDECRIL